MAIGDTRSGGVWRILGLWLVLGAGAFALATLHLDAPGLYYDEAFMAQQGKDFFHPERDPQHPGSVRTIRVFGRPFPTHNAVYLGALKGQLMIPPFAVFGASPAVLRLASLAYSLLAVLLVMLWARRIMGEPGALLGGLLVLTDPTWYFWSVHGFFSTHLLCRGAGLYLVTRGWQDRRLLPLLAGGLVLGLGVYNRADFVLIVGAAGLGLLVCRPAILGEALRTRRGAATGLVLSVLLGAAPMLVSVGDLLLTGGSADFQSRGDVAEKARVLWQTLDGSRFYRVINAGGRFERMFGNGAPAGLFGFAAILCALGLVVRALRGGRAARTRDAGTFFLVTSLSLAVAMVLLPAAVRAHHQLNLNPFVHLMVASACVLAGSATGRKLWRGLLVLGVLAVLAANLATTRQTYALVEATGGRGRWTNALHDLARELEAQEGARAVSLDWGFHEPLLLLTDRLLLSEPIWEIPRTLRRGHPWVRRGSAADRYLVHDEKYDLFGYSPRFLRAASELAAREPDAVEIRDHQDRAGERVFVSVRILAPHRLVFERGAFRLELTGDDPGQRGKSRIVP